MIGPSSVSPSLYILCSSPKISLWPPPTLVIFYTGNSQIGHSNPDMEGHNHFPQSDSHALVTVHPPCIHFPCTLSIPYRPEGRKLCHNLNCTFYTLTSTTIRNQVEDISRLRVDIKADVPLALGQVYDEMWVVVH